MAVAGTFTALVLGLLVVGVASPAFAADSTTVKLSPQSKSGESGTATLTESGEGKTKVVLNVSGGPAGVSQPVHIHRGTCAKLDPKPAFPLSPLVNGKSETTINTSLEALQKGDYAINGHKSTKEVSTYVFCGDIAGK
jgi:hypothetical protein